ncbi:MAG: PfkB family carbohydrate kinase [Thermoplasmata archaeon]|nr:PfkB family carbohydrate kinase [Thermoplasmata archaeon]
MESGRRNGTTRSPSRPRRPGLDLAVVGHTNIDHIFRVARLPATDRTVPVRNRETRLGGTAGNIARVAARLGVRTALASHIGTDFPIQFRKTLLREGVDLTAFATVRGARSPACFIVESTPGEQVTLIDQGPMEKDPGSPVPTRLLARVGWVHLATGDPHYQLRVLAEARRLGVPVTADPAQEIHYRWEPAALRRLLSGSEMFFANQDELARALQMLRIKGVRGLLEVVPLVIETQGAAGAVAWTRAGSVRVLAVRPRKVRQVTGAGDGFRGGFYAGWFRGQPLRDCLAYGSWAAARWLETGDPSKLRPREPPVRAPPDLGAFARAEV